MTVTIGNAANGGVPIAFTGVREIEGTRNYSDVNGDPVATRVVICDWEERYTIADYFIGKILDYSGTGSAGMLIYPDCYPRATQLECSEVRIDGYSDISSGTAEFEDGDLAYRYAKISATYTFGRALTWQTSWVATCSSKVDILMIDRIQAGFSFQWARDEQALANDSVAMYINSSDIRIHKGLAGEAEAKAFSTEIGYTNSQAFTIGPKVWAAGELLISGVDIQASAWDQSYYDITVSINAKSPGWSYLWRAGVFELVETIVGNKPLYPETTFSLLFTDTVYVAKNKTGGEI